MKDDEILRQYLLGALDEEKAEHLEGRLLREDDLFELAEAVEGDLLVEAVRRELSPAERGRVLRRLAASPEGRARLALSRELVSVSRELRIADVVPFRPLPRPALRAAAAAACVAAMAGGLWLATLVSRPGDGAARISGALPAAPSRTAASPTAPAAPPADRLAEHAPAPATPGSPAHRVAPDQKPSVPPEPATWSFVLALGTLRGPGDEAGPLEVPPGTRRVEIRLPLLPNEPATSFAAILRNASTEEEIRRQEGLTAHEADGEKMVVLSVPAADLAPGTYEVEVRGITKEGDELLGRPTFEVASNH